MEKIGENKTRGLVDWCHEQDTYQLYKLSGKCQYGVISYFYITTIDLPLISEIQTGKSLSATSLHGRNLVPTMELKYFKRRL